MSLLGSVLFGFSLAGCALMLVLYLRIRTKHREYWRHLGRPLLIQWIWYSHYANVGDPLTTNLSQVVKAILVVFFTGVSIQIIVHFLFHI